MFDFFKKLFSPKPDENRDQLRKHFDGNFKQFDDMEQAVLLMRLSGFSREETAEMLDIPMKKAELLEVSIITKLKDR